MKRLASIICSLWLLVPVLSAQTGETIHYGEADGLSHRHVTQILQDKDGFIWLSTWNGLDRFDGREFVTFKSRPGDGVSMPSDRFRNIAIDDHNPNIINCRVDDSWFRFSLLDGTFSPASSAQSKLFMSHPGYGNGKFVSSDETARFRFFDRQGLLWTLLDNGINLTITGQSPVSVVRWDKPAEVKCFSTDSLGRIWVASKEDKMVRIYDHGTVSYLAPDGSISATPVSFGSAIYCMFQSPQTHWNVLMGSKPDGLFQLQKDGSRYKVNHLSKGTNGQPAGEIYDIAMDGHNRMWLATMDAGLVCYDHGKYNSIRFGKESKVRRVYVLPQNIIVAITTEGFLVVKAVPGKPFSWILHCREPNRASSLSNNACMDFAMLPGGMFSDNKFFLATESGGINESTDRIGANKLTFRHYDEQSGLDNDVILSLKGFMGNDGTFDILAVSSNSLILINTQTGEIREFSNQFFRQPLSFSDARPVYLEDRGEWLLGLNDGLVLVNDRIFKSESFAFPIVLTSVTIENDRPDYMVNHLKEITLSPDERTISVSFAVLDYRNARNIRYAYRIRGDADWHYLGNDNHIRLSELAPGDYLLDLRATNAMGTWNPKIRTLKIIVEPKVTETAWFHILIILIILGILLGIFLTIRYIRRIKAKQKETLEAYLALLEKSTEPSKSPISSTQTLSPEDETIMNRIVSFVEEHISDSDISVDDMASAAALSRSSLNRKMKSLVGLTPAGFLREARIKHACSLLKTTDAPVSDIAYRCGFTDPKYFTRIFRQSTGTSPSEYRAD